MPLDAHLEKKELIKVINEMLEYRERARQRASQSEAFSVIHETIGDMVRGWWQCRNIPHLTKEQLKADSWEAEGRIWRRDYRKEKALQLFYAFRKKRNNPQKWWISMRRKA